MVLWKEREKMRKKIIAALMAFVLSVSSFVTIMGEQETKDADNITENVIATESNSKGVITERLQEYMEKCRSGYVSVTVQIKDNIDLDAIEKQALANCDITAEELQRMEEHALTLSEEENIQYQQQMLELYNQIRAQRNLLLTKYYKKFNGDFVDKQGWSEDDYESVGKLIPFVWGVTMSTEEIYDLAESGEVKLIDLEESTDDSYEISQTDTASDDVYHATVEDCIERIGGYEAINNGYTGSGIGVAVIENRFPILSEMGDDSKNIMVVNGGASTEYKHATMTCGIIKKMAPDCNIYSYAAQVQDGVQACEDLISHYNISVINMSFGVAEAYGTYNQDSVALDNLVKNSKVTIVVAAGNRRYDTGYHISDFAIAPNVIAVGGVTLSEGNTWLRWVSSCYVEGTGMINKPDLSAPQNVKIYSYEDQGTSFSAPFVTGTVVQMMSRNAGLTYKPMAVKAALMASATEGTANRSYITTTKVDDVEGAGVVDSGFCYEAAKNGKVYSIDLMSSETSATYNVYCDTTSSPFRIACVWDVVSYKVADSGLSYFNDYDIVIYKNGIPLDGSSVRNVGETGLNTNFEIVEMGVAKLERYGAGYYEVRIERYGGAQSSATITVGLAWGQP